MSERADCSHCDHKCSFAELNPYYCLWESDKESQEEYEREKRLKHFDKLTVKLKEKFHHGI